MPKFSVELSFVLLVLGASLSGWTLASAAEVSPPESGLRLDKAVPLDGNPEAGASDGEALFVSLMGAEGGSSVSDGAIRRLFWNGAEDADFDIGTPLHDPMGLAVVGAKIVILDINRIVVAEMSTGNLDREISLAASGTERLNDVARISDSKVVVSASDLKKIFLVDILSGEIRELAQDFEPHHPNGLRFDPDTGSLYISSNAKDTLGEEGNGSVVKAQLDVAAGTLRQVWSARLGKFLDGIDLQGSLVVVTDWVGWEAEGAIHELDIRTGEPRARVELKIAGLADAVWNDDSDRFAFLSLTGNQVLFYLKQAHSE